MLSFKEGGFGSIDSASIPMTYSIQIDDLSGPDIARLLQAHLDFAAAHTPAGSGHALDLEALKRPDMTFWSARDGTAVLGCIALKELDATHGEIKSMHTASRCRGRGVAKALLSHLVEEARRRGYSRLSLETGQSEGFRPSRALYESFGFARCAPFGDYVSDSFSYCMRKEL